ncbi:MAG: type II toxin-antitoxin system VapC family toxin [Alphaproteobacteria bacterium]|nr:type II toxin-antitoxin system VapC family toxin [Alphaproteobacteria bacterium]MCW5739017.1 type II toxin-antitoxin system VapC family toxin [Alphaproteobacteria bacterium]
MTELVIDASVAIKWLVPEDLRQEALALVRMEFELTAPDILIPEIGNIAWKKQVRGEIDLQQGQLIGNRIGAYFHEIVPSASVISSALDIAIALKHPIYDCFYLACARQRRAPLVTADARLVVFAHSLSPSVSAIALHDAVRALGL